MKGAPSADMGIRLLLLLMLLLRLLWLMLLLLRLLQLLNEGLSAAAAAALASAGIQHRRNAGVGRVLPTPSPAGPAGQETTQQNHTITLCIADTGA